MRKRVRRACILFALAALLLGAYVWVRLEGRGPLTPENFDRIHNGMTLAEVEEILGPPSWAASFDGTVALWDHPNVLIVVNASEAKGVVAKENYEKSNANQIRDWWEATFRSKAPF